MSVTRDGSGQILLNGPCPVEDAETLLQLLQTAPGSPVDCRNSGPLHTAVVQVILAANPKIIGPCPDPWTARWLAPLTVRDNQ